MIRKMTVQDVETVAEMERMIFTDPWSENVYRQTLELKDAVYLVDCQDDGEIIAVAGVRNIVGDGEITNVMVKPEYRKLGVAYTLLLSLIEEGRNIGVKDFTLEVRKSNFGAIKLYEKLGFVTEGIRPGFYDHPKEDACIMWMRQE